MLTLTLRSSSSGDFLARIVERSGNVFVLDYGDRRVIDDATQRIHRGFTVFRGGQLVRAASRDPNLMLLLADFYAGEGMLVSLEEPLWPNREKSLENRLADREEESRSNLTMDSLDMLGDVDEETQDLPTDVWSKADAARVKELIGGSAMDAPVRQSWSPPPTLDQPTEDESPTLDDDDEDDVTEVVNRPRRGNRGSEDES